MTKRVWVVGTSAIDTIVNLDVVPKGGSFAQGLNRRDRIGGSALNVAIALSSTGIETGFQTWIGVDEQGEMIAEYLASTSIKNLRITEVDGRTAQAIILIDANGDRTILALNESQLDKISLSGLRPSDYVIFPVWRDSLVTQLKVAQENRCITVVGLGALLNSQVRADIAIGSINDAGQLPFADYLDRFPTIVVTNGAQGATHFSTQGSIFQPALQGVIRDATGAGDAFLSGFVATLLHGSTNINKALKNAAAWATLTMGLELSAPPSWNDVVESRDDVSF